MRSPWLPAGLRNVGWRYLWVHRWQSLLMVLGITLGVAVVVAIDLANASAARAFELSTEAVTGRATHRIQGPQQGVDDRVYLTLRNAGLGIPLAPVVSETVFAQVLGARPMQLLGIDPFAEPPFRPYLGKNTSIAAAQLVSFFTHPRAVLLSTTLAAQYGLKPGDSFEIEIHARTESLFIAGLVQPQDDLSQRALDGTLLVDIATAQELTGLQDHLSWVDVILPAGDAQAASSIEALLPAGYQLTPVETRSQAIEQMTSAFRLNLSALSMLALVVGLFLIYNTMTFSVVRRRPLFGTLRCLGVTRMEIFRMVLSEALVVGVTGSILGIGLGILMGRQTVGMVVQTINDLYFTSTVQAVGIPPVSLLKGALVGVLASLITAAPPALEAASVPPRLALSRSSLEGKTQQVVMWLAAAGLVTIGLGVWLFNLPGQGLLSGFGGTLGVVFGSAMLSAFALLGLMRLASPLLGKAFGFLGRLAAGNLVHALSRTAVAVAALMVAVSVSIGVTLMITSFRHTVQTWLEVTLQGDIYVSAPAFTGTTPSVAIDPRAVEISSHWPGVQRVELLRSTNVNSTLGSLRLTAVTNQHIAYERLFMHMWVQPQDLWAHMANGEILVTEPLARRLNLLEPGRSLTLFTQDGWKEFPVVGVYYDYASSDGSVLMATPIYAAGWKDSSVTAIDLRLAPNTDVDALSTALRQALNPYQRLLVRPNQTLRADILAVFDRTFAITSALRLLATVVAFIGILNTLLLLQLEKQRETGIFRALGLSRGQLWQLVMMETGLMGLVAGLLAMPTGYALSWILIYVINQRSFGWTLQPDLPPWVFLQALLIAMSAALLSGIIPAYRLSRVPAAEAIRYE